MSLLDDLNPSQKEAVLHEGGPLLILAGAGSGKTRVLTYRIAYLIGERGVSPYDILAITFTNKAAGEMKERVRQLVGEVARDMWVSTFHSACVRILRREIGRLGMDRSFAIYDEEDQLRLIIDCLKTLNLDIKRHSPRAIHAAISNAKCELVDAESFARRAMNYFEKVTAEVYQIYQNGLYKANALDFDDLIMTAVTIFQLFPSVLEKYQEKFKHLLVDEYQDTNRAQYELVRLLSQKHRNLCVVGDDDQSIYSWRGADLRNILEFEEEFPEARTIKLERNYRSTRMILDTANSVIRNNRGRKEKALWTDRGQGDPIFWFKADNEHEEALFAAREIRRLMGEEVKFRYRDFAIFYRTNAQSRVFEDIFLQQKIPYRIIGGLRFYERKEIKDIIAYMRVIANRQDMVSLKRIINTPRRGIGKGSLEAVEAFAARNKISFSEALYRAREIGRLASKAQERLLGFVSLIEEFKEEALRVELDELVEKIWDRTGYLKELEEEGTREARGRIENLKELLTVIREFTSISPGSELDDFLMEVSLVSDIDSYDEEEDAVVLMTLHNAKGLEFPVVFMAGMEEGIFPHSMSMDTQEELEEERRLCYVGITRAKERLYLLNSWSRNLYGGVNYYSDSRFLKEISDNFIKIVDKRDMLEEAPEARSEEYRIGEKVKHRDWGIGEILDIRESHNDVLMDILFEEVGLKTLLLSLAPIKKLR